MSNHNMWKGYWAFRITVEVYRSLVVSSDTLEETEESYVTVLGADHGTETGAGRLDLCGQLSGDQGQGGSHLQAIHSSRRTGQLHRFSSYDSVCCSAVYILTYDYFNYLLS